MRKNDEKLIVFDGELLQKEARRLVYAKCWITQKDTLRLLDNKIKFDYTISGDGIHNKKSAPEDTSVGIETAQKAGGQR